MTIGTNGHRISTINIQLFLHLDINNQISGNESQA